MGNKIERFMRKSKAAMEFGIRNLELGLCANVQMVFGIRYLELGFMQKV